ncbi:MAG: hypothetical protein JWL82_549 [Parcubacteria group bacterium]|nr:hypothetical protein [Parcubacteria group bacterium]
MAYTDPMKRVLAFTRTYWLYLLLGAVLFALGVGLGWYLSAQTKAAPYRSVREISSEYKFISPFLYLEVPESTQPQMVSLKKEFQQAVDQALASGNATDVSIYFRDMNTGRWTAINRTHTFALASMLKVVTLMTVLHAAEAHPDTLSSHITISPQLAQKAVPQAYFPPAHPIAIGVSQSLEEVFWHQIVESDNTAENALESYIGLDAIKETYKDLGLPLAPDTTTDADTAQEYSHIFRVLYNSTYLSRANSQAVLDLLSRTTFDAGLVAGVPPGTTVAHKFGENLVPEGTASSSPVISELHDCGIVYYPDHPYFMCVTTKGSDFPTLANVIKDISAIAWKGAQAINPE